MLVINLISREQKKEIKLRHIYGFIKKINLVLVIIIIVVAIILMAAKIILQTNFNKITDQMTLVTKNNQGYNNKVREINDKLGFVDKIQADFIPWSKLIADLSLKKPADVSFSYLKLNGEEKTIVIRGNAKLRSSLLEFKSRLESSNDFKDINFPIKNLLEKENVNFEINAKLNLPSL